MNEAVQQKKENKMGVMPIPKLLITMSLPMMLSMLVQALYNIIDSVFVSHYSQDALTALSLAFPIQNLMIAIGAGTGVGINALLSRSLGEKKFDEANRAAVNGLFLALLSYIVIALGGFFGARAYFAAQVKNEAVIQSGYQYLSIIMMASMGLFGAMTMEKLLQATGNTFYTMITQAAGAITNIILDPILIFGLFGLPSMGAAGAALATVLGQFVSFGLSTMYNLRKNKEISLSFRGFRPNGRTIATIYKVGVPSIIMQSIGSVMTMCFNKILLAFSSSAVNVFGIYFKLNSFIFMPVFGLNNGMIPIISYNYGARHKKRIMDTVKLSVVIACGIMLFGLLLFEVFPANLLGIFNATEEMVRVGIPALRIIAISFLFAGYSIILGSVFQAFGDGFLSLLISFARQIVVILPVAWLFSKLFGLEAVWWSFPIAEIVSVIMSTFFFQRLYQKRIHNIES